jgi:hypothetical protein
MEAVVAPNGIDLPQVLRRTSDVTADLLDDAERGEHTPHS